MQAAVNDDAGAMPRWEGGITGQTDRHPCARSDAGLRHKGKLVPRGCSGLAPAHTCRFALAKGWQQGITRPV